MSKRFTDSNKWRDSWFRKLPNKAKLAWIYLCDECESHGVIDLDYELASFQLNFPFSENDLFEFFGDKIVKLSDINKYLIIPFFYFQYGSAKDSFNAKIRAKDKLQALGFTIINDKIIIENKNPTPSVGGVSPESGGTGLSIGISNSISNSIGISKIENEIYKNYPRKHGKAIGLERLRKQIKTDDDLQNLRNSLNNYISHLKENDVDSKFILMFSTWTNQWRDWLDPDHGKIIGFVSKPKKESTDEYVERLKKEWV